MAASNTHSQTQNLDGAGKRSVASAALGLVLAAAGVALMFVVASAIYGASPASDAEAFRLGLGGACLLSGLSQIFLLTGVWLILRSTRRKRA
jgi:hypothetical protein